MAFRDFPPRAVYEPGYADVAAAVRLVEAGLAKRIVLAGFAHWPELSRQARVLADRAGVSVFPAVSTTGGGVDIVVTSGPDD